MRPRKGIAVGAFLSIVSILGIPPAPAAAQATPEPQGHIRYLSGADIADYSDLRQVRPNGEDDQLLITDLYDHLPANESVQLPYTRPGFSPDLSKVVYNADDEGVWIANIDGSDGRQILPPYDPEADPDCNGVCGVSYPMFSPDGSQIASVENDNWWPTAKVIVFNADGSNLRVFLIAGTFSRGHVLQGSYSWSPDGTKVAYAMGPEDTQQSAIFVTDVNSGVTTQLTDMRAWRKDTSFSADGRLIAFSATEPESGYDGNLDLYTIRVNTPRDVRRLTNTDGYWEQRPAWSPDGRWLAYDREPADHTEPVKSSIRRINARGTIDVAVNVDGRIYGWSR